MLILTNAQSGFPLAIERDQVRGVEATSNGTVVILDYSANRWLLVKEPYAQVMRALSMRGRVKRS